MRSSRKWAGGSAQFQIGNLGRILSAKDLENPTGVGASALSPRWGFGGLLAFPRLRRGLHSFAALRLKSWWLVPRGKCRDLRAVRTGNGIPIGGTNGCHNAFP
jgi:hypothetical protein